MADEIMSAAGNEGAAADVKESVSTVEQPITTDEHTEEPVASSPQTSGDGEATDSSVTETGVAASEPTTVSPEPTTYMPVYNGKVVPITGDQKERIEELIQKGMKYDSMAETFEKLNSIAAHFKHGSVREFADAAYADMDQKLRAEAVREHGQEEGDLVYRLKKEERERSFRSFAEKEAESDAATRSKINERLATEFVELQQAYPDEYKSILDVPQKVINLALEKGIALLDAKNRYAIEQQRRVAAAVQQQAANAKSSTGSMTDSGKDVSNPALEAFRAGLRRRT